jgi:hypothetical protein
MRRYFESLRPADVSAIHSVPDGIFLVRVGSGPVSLAQAEALLRFGGASRRRKPLTVTV